MSDKSLWTRWRDSIAKRLWSGDVAEDNAQPMTPSNTSVGRINKGWEPTLVKKQDGGRKGRAPQHIHAPIEGEPRSFNPFGLRQLAQSEVIQGVANTLTGDLDAVPWSVVPVSEDVDVSQQTIRDAEAALEDINPNPETFDDVNQMFAQDLLEVGNCVATTTTAIDGRQAEAIPLDPATFTVDWDQHRLLEGFYQYPQSDENKWGDPVPFERDEVLWGTYNAQTKRGGFYGRSPVEQVARIINIMGGLVDKEIKELEEGMPSGLISLQGDEWTTQNYQNFKTYWKEEVEGNQMKHPIAEGDAEFVPFNMTYKELQVLDRQQWYAKLVGSVFRVPVSETGLAIGEGINRATDVSQRQRYKQKALGSLLSQLENIWTYQFLHRWFSEDIKVQFDLGKDLMEKETLANIHSTQLKSGTRTINEIREEVGLEPVEWGDEPFDLATYAKANTATPDTGGEPPPDDDDGGSGGESNIQEENQDALDEGTQQNQTPTQDGGDVAAEKSHNESLVENTGWGSDGGTWLPADAQVLTFKALRNTEEWQRFGFQPEEIEALQSDIEDVFERYISEVLNQIKGNQQLLRIPREPDPDSPSGMSTQRKSLTELLRIIKDTIGLSFAEDVAAVVSEHKSQQVIEGQEEIVRELRAAGVNPEEINLDETQDRVVERIQNRTLKVTKPISKRLEQDLRDVLTEAWQQGHRITEVESNIEELTDKWQGTDAERLARDQLGKASKEGRLGYAKETGDMVGGWEMEWIDSSDDRVRDSHEQMDGETVPQDEPFVVDYRPDGGPSAVEEDYPGASKWGIQCRCTFALSPSLG